MTKRKVVVTGMGLVSPLGNGVADFSASLKAGHSGIARITAFNTEGFDVQIAGEVKGFDPTHWMDKRDARKMCRFAQFAVAAATQALSQAGLLLESALEKSANKSMDRSTDKSVDKSMNDSEEESRQVRVSCDPESIGVVLGNGIGGFEVVSESFYKLFNQGPRRMLPLTVPMMISNEAAGNVSLLFGTRGPALTQVTACASGTDALGQALDLIRSGRCEVVIAGGTEACVVPFAIGGFQMLKALSASKNQEPEKAMRPFDQTRDGFVLGEGAGVLLLESEDHAVARGAKILAEFAGYGATADSYHLTAPDPSGTSGGTAIKKALADADLRPEDITYYNAHGTSTELNDVTETRLIKYAFGDHAYKLKISSIKSMTGHCVAGSGGLEAIACILAIQEGFFPPTINLEVPDPQCDLDYVPNRVQYGAVYAAASGSHGFGGHNGVVVFKRY